MRKLSYTIAVMSTVLLLSCSKEQTSAPATKNETANVSVTNVDGRLAFKDRSTFNQTVQSLINQSPQTLDKFEDGLHFSSLRRDSDANLALDGFGFPEFYKSIINAKGEYMIGDTIIMFKDGYKYLVPNKNEELLNKIKLNPSIATLKFKAGAVLAGTTSVQGSLQTQSTALNNGQTATYIHQFLRNGDPNSRRRFVFEIWNYIEAAGQTSIGYTHTKIKQEYQSGSNWRPTSTEKYLKTISNLSFDIAFFNTGNGTLSHITGANINLQQNDINNLDYVLCTFQASRSNIIATVTGRYSATVEPIWNTDGLSTYTLNAAW